MIVCARGYHPVLSHGVKSVHSVSLESPPVRALMLIGAGRADLAVPWAHLCPGGWKEELSRVMLAAGAGEHALGLVPPLSLVHLDEAGKHIWPLSDASGCAILRSLLAETDDEVAQAERPRLASALVALAPHAAKTDPLLASRSLFRAYELDRAKQFRPVALHLAGDKTALQNLADIFEQDGQDAALRFASALLGPRLIAF
jgi:hypothetical protein